MLLILAAGFLMDRREDKKENVPIDTGMSLKEKSLIANMDEKSLVEIVGETEARVKKIGAKKDKELEGTRRSMRSR